MSIHHIVFRLLLVVLALGSFHKLSAQCSTANNIGQEDCDNINTITTAVPFLLISPDSRAGGMGDAGVAVSPDVNAIHWNPSKLAFVEDEMEIAISYSPWLRNLVPDMNLAYLSFYKRMKNEKSAVGGSLRYFSLGDITFTDENGSVIRNFRPSEFAIDVAFATQLSDYVSGGLAIRYIYSNLTGGISVQGADSKAGQSVAADISMFYTNPDVRLGDKDATVNFGLNISNIGAKMSYTQTAENDFLPMNLRLGPSLTMELDKYNKFTVNVDVNKLLVPTPPVYYVDSTGAPVLDDDGEGYLVASGRDPNVGVASGIFGSFSDAPGRVTFDEQGNVQVESGSVLKEELREINIGAGFEYWYDDQFAFRGGYFWEHATKGNRKYFTLGAGVRYKMLGIDISYLIATQQRNPLANTLRFTLGVTFDSLKKKSSDDEG